MSDDWTFSVPTEDGFYWYRNKDQIGVVQIATRPDGKMTVSEIGLRDYDFLEDHPACEWIGPVYPKGYTKTEAPVRQ